MNNNDIHPIQSNILCRLLFVTEAGFSNLNTDKINSDQFSFHLRQLVGWKLIEKCESGKYCLTTKGKEYANRFDTENTEVERQPKIGVLVIAVRNKGKVKQYLMQQRLKQPYFGYWGFVTGKVKWGEKAEETALREFKEESNLEGEVKMIGLRHKTDFSKEGQLLEDKYFLTFKVMNTKGNLVENFEGGANKWMSKKEIFELEDLFDDVEEILEAVDRDTFEFKEKQYRVKRY